MCKLDLEKNRWSRDQIVSICWIIEKAREFQKNIYICFTDYTKAFDCVDHNKPWKILKRWEYQATLSFSWETYMQVKKQQLEPDMEQQTGSKFGKEYIKVVYCHPASLTRMQSAAAAAAKSLQSCPTLCDPRDGSPPGSPIPGILQARTLERFAIFFPMHESEKWKGTHSVVSDS